MDMGATTCPPPPVKPTDPVPFYDHGKLTFKAHEVGWIVSGFFALIASVTSFWLIWKHLRHYTCPDQQRHIVRMLFMVPIYSIVSWLSYLFYSHSIYYETVRDCYEAVVIVSFFNLLLQYVGSTPAEQNAVFATVRLEKWFWPLGKWKYRPRGLHFLWLMKVCILQYAIFRPLCTIAAVVLEAFDLYCATSWKPIFGHLYLALIISISVTAAMYCVVQFYIPIAEELKPYSPVLKFIAVKAVVFLTFWQASFLSVLAYFKVIHDSEYMSSVEIQAGINALLETFEMVVFGFLHIKAFTYLVYRPKDRSCTSTLRSLGDVVDFRDWAREMKLSGRYVFAKGDAEAATTVDLIRAEKHRHLYQALGKERIEAEICSGTSKGRVDEGLSTVGLDTEAGDYFGAEAERLLLRDEGRKMELRSKDFDSPLPSYPPELNSPWLLHSKDGDAVHAVAEPWQDGTMILHQNSAGHERIFHCLSPGPRSSAESYAPQPMGHERASEPMDERKATPESGRPHSKLNTLMEPRPLSTTDSLPPVRPSATLVAPVSAYRMSASPGHLVTVFSTPHQSEDGRRSSVIGISAHLRGTTRYDPWTGEPLRCESQLRDASLLPEHSQTAPSSPRGSI